MEVVLLFAIAGVIAVLSAVPMLGLVLVAVKVAGFGWRIKASLLLAAFYVLLLPVCGYLLINLCTLVLESEKPVYPLLILDLVVAALLGWKLCARCLQGESLRAAAVSAAVTVGFSLACVFVLLCMGPLWRS